MNWIKKLWCRLIHQGTWVPVDGEHGTGTGIWDKRRYWCHVCGKERTL